MKIRPILFINTFLLLTMLVSCQAAGQPSNAGSPPVINPPLILPKTIDAYPQITTRNPAVEEDYTPIAETDSLRLYYKPASSAIIVEDIRSAAIWRSSPANLQTGKGTTAAWKKIIELPVQMGYVDENRDSTKNIKPEFVKLDYQPAQGGVKVSYAYPEQNLGFAVYYTIRDDCLEATVPVADIVEAADNGMVSLELLPFFGAAQDGDDGYIVYPDGSGALMHFTNPHPPDVQKIIDITYGLDASGSFSLRGTGVYKETIVMPVFGLVGGSSAFVAIVTHGDFDSAISVAQAGKGINYNHVWSQAVFRRQGRFSLQGGQPAWLYQPDRILGDRQVRYCFLNGAEANYVGMATRYRQYLLEERCAKRMKENPPLMHIGLFMGIERRTWFLRDMISMTTFDEARQILDDLAAQGVTRLDVTLWMWNKGAVGSEYPKRLPVDPRLGGEENLRLLAEDIHNRGQRLFLLDNYLNTAPGSTEIMPFVDAVRGVDGLPIGSGETGYLLNPQVALERYAMRDIPRMASFGVDGLELDNFAALTLPDKNNRYPLSRENFAATWMKIAALSRQQFGAVSMIGPNTYAIPYSDRFDSVSVDSTHYDIFDDTVPFYHIAVHGLVPYTSMPFNLVSDNQRMYLRNIEYGAMPFFILTQANSARLFRTQANGLYSSLYTYWRSEVINQYQAMEILAPLVDQFITGHARLADGLYQTTYEDGSRVIVNYTNILYPLEGQTVPAQGFLLIPGD